MMFAPAVKSKQKVRLSLSGPSGSGKTYSALAVACALGKKVAVIDTEHGSASLYADVFKFDTASLTRFSPDDFISAIHEAEGAGYDVIVVDSLSHEWMGAGGALEMVDAAANKSGSKNSYMAWRDVTPKHNALIEAILQSKAHVIATMRAKTEYALDKDDKGKVMPRKIGMAPIQRDGMEYEFTIAGELDLDHDLRITKSRCSALAGTSHHLPGKQLAAVLVEWLESGAPVVLSRPLMEADGPKHIAQAVAVLDKAQTEADVAAVEARVATNKWAEPEVKRLRPWVAYTRNRIAVAAQAAAASPAPSFDEEAARPAAPALTLVAAPPKEEPKPPEVAPAQPEPVVSSPVVAAKSPEANVACAKCGIATVAHPGDACGACKRDAAKAETAKLAADPKTDWVKVAEDLLSRVETPAEMSEPEFVKRMRGIQRQASAGHDGPDKVAQITKLQVARFVVLSKRPTVIGPQSDAAEIGPAPFGSTEPDDVNF